MTQYCNFRLASGLILAMLMPAPLMAQTGANGTTGGISLPGSSASQGGGQTCVQVEIAGQKPSAYNCLNQQLQQEVQGAGSASPGMPLSATSPSNQVGTFNQAGVAEQYGQNFGKSVIPYRPASPVFNSALGPSH